MSITISNKFEKMMVLINKATSLFEPDYSLKDDNIYQFDRIIYALSDNIFFRENYDDSIKKSIIKESVKRYSKYKYKIKSNFYKALTYEYNQYKQIPYKKYTCIFPINIDYLWFKIKNRLKINGIYLYFRSYRYIIKKYIRRDKTIQYKINGQKYSNFTFVIINIYDKNEVSALNRANEILELFRAFLNFTDNIYTLTTTIGLASPLSKFGPSDIGLCFDSKGHYLFDSSRWVHPDHLRTYKPTFFQDFLLDLMKLVKNYNTYRNNKLKKLFTESLILYNFALDEINDYYIFLHLWQIIENIYSSNDGFDKIERRVKNIFSDKTVFPIIIEILLKKRHEIVHKGIILNLDDDDIHNLKTITDNSLALLFGSINKFNNKTELIYFVDNLTTTKEQIKTKIKILNYVFKNVLK